MVSSVLGGLLFLLVASASGLTESAAPSVRVTPSLVEMSVGCARFGAPDCPNPRHETVQVTFTVGDPGMSVGGGIGVSIGDVLGGRYQRRGRVRWGNLQNTRPFDPEYVTARTSRPTVSARILIASTPDAGTEAVAIVSGALLAGDTITVVLGDTSQGGPGMRVPGLPLRTSILVRENLTGFGGAFHYLLEKYGLEFPRLETHARQADNYLISLPAEARLGETVLATLRSVSGCEGIESSALPVRDHDASVLLETEHASTLLPVRPAFSPQDRGIMSVPVVFRHPGWQHLWVGRPPGTPCVEGGSPGGVSNPVFVTHQPPAERTLWGQLHVHTGRSRDGAGETEEAFLSARDEAGLDFLAVSDHCDTGGYDFTESTRLADAFDAPGHFAAFRAYEWTDELAGHRHVVFPDSQAGEAACETLVAATRGLIPAPSLTDLDREAAARGAVTILHHTLWGSRIQAFSFGEVDSPPLTQKLLEIHSAHGRSEFYDNQPYLMHGDSSAQHPPALRSSFQDALAQGFHFGVTAGSDNHMAQPDSFVAINPGSNNVRFPRQGLTAVLAAEISRPAIFEALTSRRTYGTTGARIWLRFTGNGQPMGATVQTAGPARLQVRVVGTAPISRIVLVRDGREGTEVWKPPVEQRAACVSFIVNDSDGQGHSYYVRIEQTDEHMAWSSPIWYAPRSRSAYAESSWPRDASSTPGRAPNPEILTVGCPSP